MVTSSHGELASVPEADLGDSDAAAAERCRRLFIAWAHESRIDRVRWVLKASGQTEGNVEAYATFESNDLCRIMPLIREKHRAEPEWDPGTPDEFALNMLRNTVLDASMAYRTRGLLGSSWKSYGGLSGAAQGKFEGQLVQLIVMSRVRFSARAAKFNETFNDRPLPTTKEEADQLSADMFSEILGRRVDTPKGP